LAFLQVFFDFRGVLEPAGLGAAPCRRAPPGGWRPSALAERRGLWSERIGFRTLFQWIQATGRTQAAGRRLRMEDVCGPPEAALTPWYVDCRIPEVAAEGAVEVRRSPLNSAVGEDHR